jgi:hypothetical protein
MCHKLSPEEFVAMHVDRAIENKNIRFLAYLLVDTHGRGAGAMSNLRNKHEKLTGLSLDSRVPELDAMLEDEFPEYSKSRFNTSVSIYVGVPMMDVFYD